MNTNRARDEWRAEIREVNAAARSTGWRIALWVVAVVVLFGLIGGGIWAFKVATADVKGRGDVVRKVNDADNRLFAQGNFLDLYNEVKAADRKLDQAAADKAAHPHDTFFATTYTGLKAHCEDARAQYNAAAQKISQAKFRDENLPAQIEDSNPETDCQEKAK
jgi:hypothetical protein